MSATNLDRKRIGVEYSIEEAENFDSQDSLRHLRSEFIIPTKGDLKRKTLSTKVDSHDGDQELSIYFCGNSLGLQPRRTSQLVASHLTAWATKGVYGHFKAHDDSDIPPFVDVDQAAAIRVAPIVGALPSEVAVMETLTANLHLMMASFYRPTKEKYKIILEGKAFPSDHYAVESQIRFHNFDPKSAMVLIEPSDSDRATLSTAHILAVIDRHASSTALIMLPGIQYYTGQYFDIKVITAHAHSLGIAIGWDLAHAIGNVELELHEWEVDFAVWCSYKYLNSGPGAIGGLFVHEKHGQVDQAAIQSGHGGFRPRLSGWWGGDKGIRFQMENHFVPTPGAAGFQVGNSCALAVCTVFASLEIFALTSMAAMRQKSVALTNYLEELLQRDEDWGNANGSIAFYHIITPPTSAERGAQLSIRLNHGLLDGVLPELEDQGVVVDERQPDVIRVAPAPLYNTFTEVWRFVQIFKAACQKADARDERNRPDATVQGGRENKGWSHIQ